LIAIALLFIVLKLVFVSKFFLLILRQWHALIHLLPLPIMEFKIKPHSEVLEVYWKDSLFCCLMKLILPTIHLEGEFSFSFMKLLYQLISKADLFLVFFTVPSFSNSLNLIYHPLDYFLSRHHPLLLNFRTYSHGWATY
jgi:hypothetical protein